MSPDTLIDALPQLLVVSAAEGRAVCNKRWRGFTGIHDDWLEAVHPSDRRLLGRCPAEVRVRDVEGGYTWMSAHASPLEQSTVYTFTPLSAEHHRAYARVDELERIADTIPVIVFTTTPEGHDNYHNPAWYRYTGLSPAESDGRGWESVIHPDDLTEVVTRWNESLLSGLPYDTELRLRRHDGEYRWHISRSQPQRDETGRIVRWFGTCTDIDERKRADDDMRAREDYFRTMTEAIPQMVWTSDAAGQIDYLNSNWAVYAGVPLEQLQGEGTRTLLHPDDVEATLEAWRRALPTGEDFDSTYRLRKADGTYRWFVGRATAIRDRDGRIIRWFGSATDIDDQKRAEELLERRVAERTVLSREAEEHLRESNQRLLDLAYVVSHELQEPLRVMDGQLRLLSARYSDRLGRDADEFIGKATRAGRYVSRMVDDLWTYARIDRPNTVLAHVDMNDVVARALERIDETVRGKAAKVTCDVLPTVLAVPQQMSIVIEELLSNALHYNRSTPPEVHVGAEEKDGGWTFSVRDNGIGFDMVDAGEVFKMFRRLQRDDEDRTGMGLAICRRIVEFHGGRMGASSTRGGGTTMWFTLPAG